MEHLSNDHEDRPNQHENSHKLCNETGHPFLSLLEGQWKLKQQDDQNFPMGEKPLQRQKQILASEERKKPEEKDWESHSQ